MQPWGLAAQQLSPALGYPVPPLVITSASRLQMKADKPLSSEREGLTAQGKQLTALEQRGGFKPGGGSAQPASAGAMGKGDRWPHIPFLSLLTAAGQAASWLGLAESWASWLAGAHPSADRRSIWTELKAWLAGSAVLSASSTIR